MTVRSPKTEHHKGKASRQVPLFPELRGLLKTALEASEAKDGFVVSKCTNATQNFRRTFIQILKRAGLKPWPKLFQNMRSTRQTELCEVFASHVVSAWIGNSERVAKEHDLQVTDTHFLQASGQPLKTPEVVATQVATKAPERRSMKPFLRRSRNEKSREIRGSSYGYVTVPLRQMGAEGLESKAQSSGNSAHPKIPGVQTGAIDSDSERQGQLRPQALEDLQRAWKSLRLMETLSDNQEDSKAAERALAFVDKAFAELEGSKH